MAHYTIPRFGPYMNGELPSIDELCPDIFTTRLRLSRPSSPSDTLRSDNESSESDEGSGYVTSTRHCLRAARRSSKGSDHALDAFQAETDVSNPSASSKSARPFRSGKEHADTPPERFKPRWFLDYHGNFVEDSKSNAFDVSKRRRVEHSREAPVLSALPSVSSVVDHNLPLLAKHRHQLSNNFNEEISNVAARTVSSKSSLGLTESVRSNKSAAGSSDKEALSSYGEGKGPVVNHLPQSERRSYVHHVIAGVKKVFDPLLAELPPTLTTDPVADTRQHGSSTEPADGNGQPGQRPPRNDTRSNNYTASQGIQCRQRSLSSEGPEDHGLPEDQDPEDIAGSPSSSVINGVGYTCVFHHPENTELDETGECKTPHRFVSHLRTHHGCSKHLFFYCGVCFMKFSNKDERDNHKPLNCKTYKCVTVGCQNCNTFSTATCNHPGRKNSQLSIWMALFEMARPSDTMLPVIGTGVDVYSPAIETSTPGNPSSMQTVLRDSATTPRSHVMSSSSRRRPSRAIATHDLLLNTASNGPRYIQALETLASLLLDQLESLDPDGLDVLGGMYNSYMNTGIAELSNSTRSNEIEGLKTLCRKMWVAVQDPSTVTPKSKSQLRAWAHGVLPQREGPAMPIAPRQSNCVQWQYPDTPTPAQAGPSRNVFHQDRSSPLGTLGSSSFAHDMTDPNAQTLDEVADYTFDLCDQPSTVQPPILQDPQPNFQAQQSGAPARYMPFTHTDSAEALNWDWVALSKTPTRDSGYRSANTENMR